MRGGASGAHSAVQPPRPDTIAHETFHWWNSGDRTRAEAGWFHEGLTTLYGLRFAEAAGATPATKVSACLADLQQEMRILESEGPVSLAEAARQRQNNRRMERLMYSKGALFALLLESRLRTRGRSLDEAVRRVLAGPSGALGNDDLKRVFSTEYAGAVDGEFDTYVVGSTRLPEADFATPPTGASGCAFFR